VPFVFSRILFLTSPRKQFKLIDFGNRELFLKPDSGTRANSPRAKVTGLDKLAVKKIQVSTLNVLEEYKIEKDMMRKKTRKPYPKNTFTAIHGQ